MAGFNSMFPDDFTKQPWSNNNTCSTYRSAFIRLSIMQCTAIPVLSFQDKTYLTSAPSCRHAVCVYSPRASLWCKHIWIRTLMWTLFAGTGVCILGQVFSSSMEARVGTQPSHLELVGVLEPLTGEWDSWPPFLKEKMPMRKRATPSGTTSRPDTWHLIHQTSARGMWQESSVTPSYATKLLLVQHLRDSNY